MFPGEAAAKTGLIIEGNPFLVDMVFMYDFFREDAGRPPEVRPFRDSE
jgi:hypothetical protein